MRTFTATDAKNHFGAILDTVELEPVKITRKGKLAAYVVSAREFESISVSHSFVTAVTRAAASDPAVMDVLTKYSQGHLRKEDAMKELGLQYYSQLLDLLGIADLPLPMVPKRLMNSMVREALAMLKKVKVTRNPTEDSSS